MEATSNFTPGYEGCVCVSNLTLGGPFSIEDGRLTLQVPELLLSVMLLMFFSNYRVQMHSADTISLNCLQIAPNMYGHDAFLRCVQGVFFDGPL